MNAIVFLPINSSWHLATYLCAGIWRKKMTKTNMWIYKTKHLCWPVLDKQLIVSSKDERWRMKSMETNSVQCSIDVLLCSRQIDRIKVIGLCMYSFFMCAYLIDSCIMHRNIPNGLSIALKRKIFKLRNRTISFMFMYYVLWIE